MAKKNVALPLLVLAAALAGCVNFSALDNLDTVTPPTEAFDLALFKNYAFLAHSFGQVGQSQYGGFDQNASLSISETENTVADLANAYADRALRLSREEVVDPEPSLDIKTHEQRDRLARALLVGREAFPRDAARAQADWDCWHLNATVSSQLPASQACHNSFEITLPRLEAEVAPVVAARAKQEADKKKAGPVQNDSADASERL